MKFSCLDLLLFATFGVVHGIANKRSVISSSVSTLSSTCIQTQLCIQTSICIGITAGATVTSTTTLPAFTTTVTVTATPIPTSVVTSTRFSTSTTSTSSTLMPTASNTLGQFNIAVYNGSSSQWVDNNVTYLVTNNPNVSDPARAICTHGLITREITCGTWQFGMSGCANVGGIWPTVNGITIPHCDILETSQIVCDSIFTNQANQWYSCLVDNQVLGAYETYLEFQSGTCQAGVCTPVTLFASLLGS